MIQKVLDKNNKMSYNNSYFKKTNGFKKMISLTREEATNLNKVLGIISLQTQSDEIPAFHLDDRNGLVVVFKLNNFEDSIGDDLEEEGFESTVVEDEYLFIEI